MDFRHANNPEPFTAERTKRVPESMTDEELNEAEAIARRQLAEAYAMRVSIIRERERRGSLKS